MPKLKVGPSRGCRLGHCVTFGTLYGGGNDWVKKTVHKGICPECRCKLTRPK
jgi:hypothetical protein